METTVEKLAHKLGISRTGVEMRIKRIPNFRKKYVRKVSNRIMINEKGAELVTKLNGINPVKRVKNKVNNVNDVTDSVTDVKNKSLEQELKSERLHNQQLVKQLNRINESHKSLERSNRSLENLLNQQQQLQLSTQRENNHLKGHIKHLKEISGPHGKSTERSPKPIREERHGFFYHLFH